MNTLMKTNSYAAAAVTCVVLAFAALPSQAAETNGSAFRPRVVISTDFPPTNVVMRDAPPEQCSDPDDMQSIVRFLLYVNEFDVEGIIVSSGTFANKAKKQNMLDVMDLYAKVEGNLRKHDPRYPTADKLRAVVFQGRDGTWGGSVDRNIGEGKDSEASEAIINIVDKPDPRPVWFCFWGTAATWRKRSGRCRRPAALLNCGFS